MLLGLSYLPPYFICESLAFISRIGLYLLAYPCAAHVYERELSESYVASAFGKAFLVRDVLSLLTAR